MKTYLLASLLLVLTACAEVPMTYERSPWQDRADALVAAYSAAHHVMLIVPAVSVGPTTPLVYANDFCPRNGGGRCYLTLNTEFTMKDPAYQLTHTLPHEVAHALCVQTVPSCTSGDHGPAWRRIAVELGLPPDDPYLLRPEEGVHD